MRRRGNQENLPIDIWTRYNPCNSWYLTGQRSRLVVRVAFDLPDDRNGT